MVSATATRQLSAIRLAALAFVSALLVSACDGDTVVVPAEETPFLYLVLGEPSIDLHAQFDSVRARQHALLLALGSPAENARYLTAESFTMRERGAGTLFGWEHTGIPYDEVGSFPGVSFREPNYRLPHQTPATAGADDLRPGAVYTLEIRTPLGTITGETTMPGPIDGRIIESNGATIVVWSPVPGAAGYRVLAEHVDLVTDTMFRLPSTLDGGQTVWIEALDANVWYYLTDEALARAGIQGGHGVFGALSRDSVR